MILKKFKSNTNILRNLDYISANIQDSSTGFLTKNSAEICNALKSRIDTVASQDICRKLVLDKISFDHRDSISKTLLIKLGGIKPETFTLNLILDFFQYGRSYYTYWQVVDKGLTSYLVQYSDQKHADYAFTQLSDFEFSGSKLLVSHSIGLEDLSAFELSLINNPQADIRWSKRGYVFIKKTPRSLISLWYDERNSSGGEKGDFMFSNGKFVRWYVFFGATLCIKKWTTNEKFKISREDLEHLYSMLETHVRCKESLNWRKLELSFE